MCQMTPLAACRYSWLVCVIGYVLSFFILRRCKEEQGVGWKHTLLLNVNRKCQVSQKEHLIRWSTNLPKD